MKLTKKLMLLVSVTVFSFSAISLDISNMDGAYYILKGDDDKTFDTNVYLSKINSDTRSFDSAKYAVQNDVRFAMSEFEFENIDNQLYASFKDNKNSSIYEVTENTDFSMTLVNIDDYSDIITLVYDKEYNKFKFDDYYDSIAHMTDDGMISRLHDMIDNQKDLGYTGARKAFFGEIDNVDGVVECVYTGKTIKTSGIPNHTIMNCEHTWPQSKFGGAEKGTKKSDINHLFPTDSKSNSRRSNYPFGNVRKVTWQDGGSKLGTSDLGNFTVFEPRDEHKGDVARAMFYFAVRYTMAIDAHQENTLRKWHELDPVSEKEIARNAGVEEAQGNRNPFIDRPEFVDNIRDF
ncbi:MAG: endonuclease [Candidatus Muirbacterium halophilum]|nr:endonuclease [Candidatus Muirbacterium halophilum]MCK9475206.1 endonuclease [Candidatus Muirbacterium halophilum]